MIEDEAKTEREQYIEQLEGKVRKAVLAKRFNESEEGKMLRDWAASQVNGVIKQLAGSKFINDHNAYVYATGELSAYQKMVTMLDSEASRNVGEMTEQLKAAKSDNGPAK